MKQFFVSKFDIFVSPPVEASTTTTMYKYSIILLSIFSGLILNAHDYDFALIICFIRVPTEMNLITLVIRLIGFTTFYFVFIFSELGLQY